MKDQFRAGKRLWNAADDAALRRLYPDTPTGAVAQKLRRTVQSVYVRAQAFGITKSAAYLASPAACRLRRGDGIGTASRFKKGQTPANKGLRRPGWAPGRMRETQFTKGVRRGVALKLWKPIGTERMSKDGYLERKVNNDLPLQARWRAVHLVEWEQVHGPIPAGHALVFRNGDKADRRLDNLECITRAALMARNSIHRLPEALADTVRLLGRVNRQIRRRTRDAAEQDRRLA